MDAEKGVRPCPFCNGQPLFDKVLRDGYAERQDDPDAWAYFFRCRSCACTGGWGKSESSARRYWNMRPDNPPSEQEIKPRKGLIFDVPLNNAFVAQLIVPVDITKQEAWRLGEMLKTLPIDE